MVGTLVTVLHDVLVVLGVVAALAAVCVLANIGLLLPGLLTSIDGRHGNGGGAALEPGPADPRIITEPARPRTSRVATGSASPAASRA